MDEKQITVNLEEFKRILAEAEKEIEPDCFYPYALGKLKGLFDWKAEQAKKEEEHNGK